ncbi:NnrS family protein [Ferrovibrio sp.]|uniref:NnrS family protein n=1 Tax=Ferrovibrio sp. TaxID=1917215 RepID=UPI002611510E|nr:NnrS family protein [Ferrovibrio sp.]
MTAAALHPAAPRQGWAVFALGFRPFYLAGAAFAFLILPLWLAVYGGHLALPLSDPLAWHGHEMLFGFGAAIIAGFLLTAVRNWTGHDTPTGTPLALLMLLWLAGRLAMLVLPGWPGALVDLAFLPALAVALAPPIFLMRVRKASQRPWLPLVVLSLLTIANLLHHAGALGFWAEGIVFSRHLALGVVAILISVIAARIVPSFTMSGAGVFIPAALRRDRIALIVLVLAVALDVAAVLWTLPPLLLVAANAAAALLHASRLQQWQSWSARRVPLLAILHIAYLWLPLAFALRATSAWSDMVTRAMADHALGVGAMAGLMLAMMTRSALGHTGRPLKAGPVELGIYAAITLAALLRFCALAHPALQWPLLLAAGIAWEAAFGLFLLRYLPILLRPRIDRKPG